MIQEPYNPPHIQELIRRGALFFSNHSGGKDSQAMFAYLRTIVPKKQLIIIHSHLPEVEWEGTKEHIWKYAYGYRFRICQAKKTFFEMVEHRQMFPSPKNRQCTSDLKRGPLEKLVREISKESHNLLIVNCMGMRAQESSKRSKLTPFKFSKRNSKAGREWYEWLPIHSWSEEEVFQTIANNDEEPFWTYGEGMKRKSCSFCIMACQSDLKIASRLRPALFQKYVETEKRIGHTLMMPTKKHGVRTLDQLIK
jgi:DNA sulfur modification protein DndC